MFRFVNKYRFWISGGILIVLGTCFMGSLVKNVIFANLRKDEGKLVGRAREAFLNGQYIEAVDLYEKAIVLEPEQAEIVLDLAIIYDDYLGNSEKSLELYKKYLQINPKSEKRELVEEWMKDSNNESLGIASKRNEAIGEQFLLLQKEMEDLTKEKQKLEKEVERLSGKLYSIQAEHQEQLRDMQEKQEKLVSEITEERMQINMLSRELKKTESTRQKLQEKLLTQENKDVKDWRFNTGKSAKQVNTPPK